MRNKILAGYEVCEVAMCRAFNKMGAQEKHNKNLARNLKKTDHLTDREDGNMTFSVKSYGNGSKKEGRGRSDPCPLLGFDVKDTEYIF